MCLLQSFGSSGPWSDNHCRNNCDIQKHTGIQAEVVAQTGQQMERIGVDPISNTGKVSKKKIYCCFLNGEGQQTMKIPKQIWYG